MNLSRLGIGTVQFGLPYGATNTRGQVPLSEIAAILQQAGGAGISTLDTASAYGTAEAALGECGVPLNSFSIVTKIPAHVATADEVRTAVEASLTKLKVQRLYAVLAHQASTLLGPQGTAVWRALHSLQSEGLMERIGASVYTVAEAQALRAKFQLGLVQLPYSVFNQSFAMSGELSALKATGCEVHARSVFLQGTLLTNPAQLPAYFTPFRPLFDDFHGACSRLKLTPMQACLSQALSQAGLDKVIVGVTSVQELEQILQASNGAGPVASPEWQRLHSNDERLINPALWKL